jgi:hypothetical protein
MAFCSDRQVRYGRTRSDNCQKLSRKHYLVSSETALEGYRMATFAIDKKWFQRTNFSNGRPRFHPGETPAAIGVYFSKGVSEVK